MYFDITTSYLLTIISYLSHCDRTWMANTFENPNDNSAKVPERLCEARLPDRGQMTHIPTFCCKEFRFWVSGQSPLKAHDRFFGCCELTTGKHETTDHWPGYLLNEWVDVSRHWVKMIDKHKLVEPLSTYLVTSNRINRTSMCENMRTRCVCIRHLCAHVRNMSDSMFSGCGLCTIPRCDP